MSSKRYSQLSPEQRLNANRRNAKWKAKNRSRVLEYKKKHYQNNKEKYNTLERDRQYRKRYGITLIEYNSLLERQQGRCAICKAEEAGRKRQHFAVDHDHLDGRVRGLLCIACNVHLGWYESRRSAVIEYLDGEPDET